MNVQYDFQGKIVLVTGAAGELGSAVCQAFHEAGATVIGTDIESIADADSTALTEFHQADFTDETAVSATIDEIIDSHGKLDYLANIAGTWMGGNSIADTSVETFETLFAVNLKTMFLASKHALPHLEEQGGAIVSVSARSSLEGGSGDGLYRASKAGVRLLTETIAEEYKGRVRANAVMPSVIDTPMNRDMMPDANHDAWVQPADIAAVICWLCSEGSSVTSGAAVPVYGEA